MSVVHDALTLGTRHRLYRLRTRAVSALLATGRRVAIIAAAVTAGWASAWYMVEAGTDLTVVRVGPWVNWIAAARPDADPYTRAHFARSGSLPLNSVFARTWTAKTDDTGERLHSACDYVVEGARTSAWWSIGVFDDKGRLIANPAARYSYTSDTVAATPSGAFAIALARDARPNNWLPTGGAGRLSVQLTMLDQRSSLTGGDSADAPILPTIKRIQCR